MGLKKITVDFELFKAAYIELGSSLNRATEALEEAQKGYEDDPYMWRAEQEEVGRISALRKQMLKARNDAEIAAHKKKHKQSA